MRLEVPTPPLAITLDLDDTLWPIMPTIEKAERALRDWLGAHAPATGAALDAAAWRALRERVERERPEWAHDLGRLRLETIRRGLEQAGDDPALAEPAFDCFFEHRQRVEPYDDAVPALRRLAGRYPLWAISNGNADLRRVGLAEHFAGGLSASEFGLAKPRPEIFHESCRRLGVAPDRVLHVGDDLELDVRGALAAGLRAVWVDRRGEAPARGPDLRVPDLGVLADALGC